jgi:hypothetical protein
MDRRGIVLARLAGIRDFFCATSTLGSGPTQPPVRYCSALFPGG